jgi:hypothetical protein
MKKGWNEVVLGAEGVRQSGCFVHLPSKARIFPVVCYVGMTPDGEAVTCHGGGFKTLEQAQEAALSATAQARAKEQAA